MKSRFHSTNDLGEGTAFRDVLFGTLGVLAAVVIILLLLPKLPEEAEEAESRSRGNIRVEVMWPDDYNVDVDTWGKAPGLPSVGYSNKNGPVLNLVRDDLGNYADVTGRNYEVMFSRGLPSGEWTFNLHWFSNTANKISVPVEVYITITYDDSGESKETPTKVVSTKMTLSSPKQELTIVRFRLDDEGKLVEDSITSLFKPIRSAGNGGG